MIFFFPTRFCKVRISPTNLLITLLVDCPPEELLQLLWMSWASKITVHNSAVSIVFTVRLSYKWWPCYARQICPQQAYSSSVFYCWLCVAQPQNYKTIKKYQSLSHLSVIGVTVPLDFYSRKERHVIILTVTLCLMLTSRVQTLIDRNISGSVGI